MLKARTHRRVLVAIALAVVAAHALLLGGMDDLPGPSLHDAAGAAVQVRAIDAPAPAPAVELSTADAAEASPPLPPPSPAARPRRPARSPGLVEAARPAVDVAAAPPQASASEPVELATVPVPSSSATAVATLAAAPHPAASTAAPPSAAATPTEPPPPTYATHLPPSATLRYDLQRGSLGGSGELRWQLDGDRYDLRLESSVVGIVVLLQVSQGSIDAAGIAPHRFTDQRVRRAALAANFQREAHKVTFSGTAVEVPLAAGAQDRLSWMVQLAAIVAADPARGEPGAKTALQVVGARGDSGVWVFRCLGVETLETRAGAVPTLHLVRESRGPYDTAVAIWLDPARHHLPLRATLRNGDDGEVLEMRLKDMTVGG